MIFFITLIICKIHDFVKDKMNLPKPIGFEVDDDGSLPPTQPSFFFNDDVKNIIVNFLQQYFQVMLYTLICIVVD